jgi:hypothetical protein
LNVNVESGPVPPIGDPDHVPGQFAIFEDGGPEVAFALEAPQVFDRPVELASFFGLESELDLKKARCGHGK